MTLFNGPVFQSQDPTYQSARMDRPIKIPLAFWKVAVIAKEDGSLAAAGFLLSQEDLIGDASELERFDASLYQVRIADIEQRTGLDFGKLRDVDSLVGDVRFESSGAGPGALRIDKPEDIRI